MVSAIFHVDLKAIRLCAGRECTQFSLNRSSVIFTFGKCCSADLRGSCAEIDNDLLVKGNVSRSLGLSSVLLDDPHLPGAAEGDCIRVTRSASAASRKAIVRERCCAILDTRRIRFIVLAPYRYGQAQSIQSFGSPAVRIP